MKIHHGVLCCVTAPVPFPPAGTNRVCDSNVNQVAQTAVTHERRNNNSGRFRNLVRGRENCELCVSFNNDLEIAYESPKLKTKTFYINMKGVNPPAVKLPQAREFKGS